MNSFTTTHKFTPFLKAHDRFMYTGSDDPQAGMTCVGSKVRWCKCDTHKRTFPDVCLCT